ncbi:MAG: 50S ribosomal protein L10 [Acidimicrobiales bacterium]
MAIENPRPEKVAVVDEVRERLSSATATLLTEYRGLKVEELAELRQSVRAAGGDYKIYKNTLVRLAVADLGLEGLDHLLVGPTGVAFVDGDAVLVAKALKEFAKTAPNLVVKGGVLGRTALSAADAASLADVAPREVVLAQLAGAFAAPLRQFAGLLAALPRNLAYGLAALIDKRGGPQAVTDEAPPAVADVETSETPTDPPAPDAGSSTADAPVSADPETPAPETPAPEMPAPEAPAPETPDPEAPAPEAQAPAPAAEAPEAPAPEAPEAPAPEAPAPEEPASEAPAPEAPEAPAPEAPVPEAGGAASEAPEAVVTGSSDEAPEAVVPVQQSETSDVPAVDAPAASAQPTTESPDGNESADKEQ